MTEPNHQGVSLEDPRNRGPIAHFRPPEVTEDYVRLRFKRVFHRETPAQIDARVARFLADLASKTPRATPPLGQSLDEVPHPFFELGVHPDVVEQLWRLDRSLPLSSRWMVWGHPALVHPQTGIIFAVAIGTLGIVARLPPRLREGLAASHPLNFGETFDVTAAGPEWRFLTSPPNEALILAAFEDAALREPKSGG